MPSKPFYITTTLPYVNAEPHIGFAMELIRADIVARYHRLSGPEVFMNTGTDEHGLKVYRKAKELGLDTQAYVDSLAEKYKALIPALGVDSGVNFIRTTDAHHKKAAQAFWDIVNKNGFIYKKNYSVKYCVGCELEKTESELVNGRCPIHPLMELEIIQEENYFFKFSAFEKQLLDLYECKGAYADRAPLIVPEFRMNEAKSFVSQGLEDFSISRLATKMSWGIPVPGDPAQVMYVWFDALVDYISAIGWPDDEVGGTKLSGSFNKWWVESGGVVQYCGKDNLRQQSAMWQAMLMAADLPPSKHIIIDGFITGEGGLKMSKSLGNTVDPLDIVKEYGIDALRYYVARELSPFEDSPFTPEKFKEGYNANLANGIGNLTSRIMKMSEGNLTESLIAPALKKSPTIPVEYTTAFENYNLQQAAHAIWAKVAELDKRIQVEKPFSLVKEKPEEAKKLILDLVIDLNTIARLLVPFMPETAAAIQKCIAENKMPEKPLFLRK